MARITPISQNAQEPQAYNSDWRNGWLPIVLQMCFASLAEFERGVIRERVTAGIAAAKARGRVGGRPRVMDTKKLRMARALLDGGSSVSEVCEALSVSQATLYRYLAKEQHEAVA